MRNNSLTQDELHGLVDYDRTTGIMKKNGEIIGGEISNNDRYLKAMLLGTRYKIHRLAWLYVYGEFPKEQIDHINGDRLDNRICNLRDVSQIMNNQNSAKRIDNTSGCVGVKIRLQGNKILWIASIGGKPKKYLGIFNNINDAIIARKMAEYKLGYHENHGR